MEDRELSDTEWAQEIRSAVVAFRRAMWTERKRDRDERETNPWLV